MTEAQLRALLAVVDAGGFGAAAEALSMSESPIPASYRALRLVALQAGQLLAYRRYAELGDVELEYGEWNDVSGSRVLEVPCDGRRDYLMVSAVAVSTDVFAEATIEGC
jgi:hypothetical protein